MPTRTSALPDSSSENLLMARRSSASIPQPQYFILLALTLTFDLTLTLTQLSLTLQVFRKRSVRTIQPAN